MAVNSSRVLPPRRCRRGSRTASWGCLRRGASKQPRAALRGAGSGSRLQVPGRWLRCAGAGGGASVAVSGLVVPPRPLRRVARPCAHAAFFSAPGSSPLS